MIVAVTGTLGLFPRLTNALESYRARHPSEALWVQHGRTPLPPAMQGEALVPREALLERMRMADVVICHAGSGTLLDALSLGHMPVVFPRLARFGEHVNDHQLELVEALSAEGRIIAVLGEEPLDDAVARARGHVRSVDFVSSRDRLVRALQEELAGIASAPVPRRRRWLMALTRVATRWVRAREMQPLDQPRL